MVDKWSKETKCRGSQRVIKVEGKGVIPRLPAFISLCLVAIIYPVLLFHLSSWNAKRPLTSRRGNLCYM